MENDKNKNAEQKPVSPNELMFARQDKEKKEKRPSGKRRGVIIAVAVLTAVAIILCALIFSGALGRFMESFMLSPEEQVALVLKREAKAFVDGKSDFEGFSLDLPLSYRGSIETRVDEQFLELINKLKLVDADLTALKILNDIDLYYRTYMDEAGTTLRLNLAEDGSSFGAEAFLDHKSGIAYFGVPLLSPAYLCAQSGLDMSLLGSLNVNGIDDARRDELVSLSEQMIDAAMEHVDTVEREKETIEGDKAVKCDRLSFTVDRGSAVAMIDSVTDIMGEQGNTELFRTLLGEELFAALENVKLGGEEALPADFTLSVTLWVHDGEMVGVNLTEKATDTGFYRMEPTNVIEVSTNIMGLPVKIGGQSTDGNGQYTVRSLMGMRVGKIVTEGLKVTDGLPEGRITVTLSDEVVELGSSLGEGFLGAILGKVGDLSGYAVVLDFTREDGGFMTELTVRGADKELLYLEIDAAEDDEGTALDMEGKDTYTVYEFDEYRDTVKVTGDLLDAILNGPDVIADMIPEKYRGLLEGAGMLPDSMLDFALGGILDDYIDPILDKVQAMLPAEE